MRHGVIGIARELERRLPDLVTTSWWKEERGERVFVDFNQACRDRTIASAYSPRPLPGAPVSTPVTWEELRTSTPGTCTVRTVPELVAGRGDAWAGLDEAVGDVADAIALWDKDIRAWARRAELPARLPEDARRAPARPAQQTAQDKSDDEYMAPKADRDAELRTLWGPVVPPYAPMLAKAVKDFGAVKGEVVYEPKWDGFRSIIFRSGDEVEIGSRNEKPMTRYFPEIVEAVRASFPERAVIDGEIILVDPADGNRLDFELLQQRIHPAASRVRKLSVETPPASSRSTCWPSTARTTPAGPSRAARRSRASARRRPAPHPPDRRHEGPRRGQGLVRAVRGGRPRRRHRQARRRHLPAGQAADVQDQARADRGLRRRRLPHAQDRCGSIGSLLLGLYDAAGNLASVGVIGALPMARRRELYEELQPLVAEWDEHPWNWAKPDEAAARTPRSSEFSRWNNQKDLSFTPLRPERVVEVRYDHMEGTRFRHTAQFVRWRDDRDPAVMHLRAARGAHQLRPRRRPVRGSRLSETAGRTNVTPERASFSLGGATHSIRGCGANRRTSCGQPQASAILPAHMVAASSSATSTTANPPRNSLVST